MSTVRRYPILFTVLNNNILKDIKLLQGISTARGYLILYIFLINNIVKDIKS